ncbi:MAG: ThuA domain-containing protein [Verrucomicrobiales bacterium]|nr:ThuA domain-containing protein [Verrucomicrobiales bacterium]
MNTKIPLLAGAILLALSTFVFADDKPHAVIVVGTHHYSPQKTMPPFAAELERLGFRTTVINPEWDPEKDKRGLPGTEALAEADVALFFTRFLKLDEEQLRPITAYLESGKPVVGFRTSTHGFNYPAGHPRHELNDAFGRDALGTPYLIHLAGETQIKILDEAANHPVLTGVDAPNWQSPGTLYLTDPEPGIEPLLLGTGNSKRTGKVINQFGTHHLEETMTDTVAWTWTNKWGGRTFTTSLGHAGDFAVPQSMRVMVNGVFWAAGLEVPGAEVEIRPFVPGKSAPKLTDTTSPKPGETKVAKEGNDTILFYGNSMIERLLEHGELEARLQIALPDEKLKIRSLAWTGDEVGNRLRLEGYAKHMKNLLAEWPANTIVLGYGMNEAFAGEEGLAEFREHYAAHLKQLSNLHPGASFVLLSLISTEKADTESYSKAIADLADQYDATFVDLHSLTQQSGLTSNGVHLNSKGNGIVAKAIAAEFLRLRGQSPADAEADPAHLREVALAAAAKHERVAEVVRPKNAVVYFGVRARPKEYAEEMPRYLEMIRLAEKVVHDLANDPKLTFSDQTEPALPPLPEREGRGDGDRTGIIKTVAENQAEFEVAEGYAVNLFASEEEFPELRNPVQIAFDARGRLWVVTMPSFPHTVPGLTPPDKIIILEDTDRDGKADKLTTFAEGLDALDGVAFHRDGVIISEQPRLWLMRDTDGDDIADAKSELLRGIDVTDSHHGGMIATDPMGDVIFSDGVFHRSQLETAHGVIRGIDATTYRLDPITGRINTEWQHTTPNPWNVTFDRWGNTFQMYGDGQVYDGSSLIWTPLGAYHPFRYAHVCSYGKGSGLASISSPNFPDDFQQGVASASLLGRYAVNLTQISYDEGMVKEVGHKAILSSPNAAFRPADVEFGMDGALYVSDFCSPIIGHAQHPMRDPHWDHDFGRIWRIVHTEKPIVNDWPKIEGATVEELCSLLTHSQDLVRHHARIELRKNGEAGLAAVDQWMAGKKRDDPDFEQAALESLFVCEGLAQVRPEWLEILLQSESPKYRAAGIQVLRLQADRLDDVQIKLVALVNDPHPRVQIEVIDAVAHLRPSFPGLESVLATITPVNKHVSDSLAYLDYGIEPAKGRSVPVLDVAKESQLMSWHYLGVEGENTPVELQIGQAKFPGEGLFRTFVHSDKAQPAIVAINHKNLEVRVNDILKFSQNSLWSGDQQVNVELEPGLNVIEIKLGKGRRSGGSMPPVYLYDPVGQALAGAQYPTSLEILQASAGEYDKMIAERGNLLFIQAAAGLQFSPTQLRATPGSKVRLVFENPDIMMHNWVLLKPGSFDEVGAMADAMAAQPDGMEKEYLPDTDKILVASKLLGPKAKQELVFTAPTEPGEYPYVCTFPGHWRIMKGVLTVADPAPAKTTTEAPPAGNTVTKAIGDGVVFETASSPNGFTTLKPPAKSAGKVVANQKTNNDPIAILTDAKLSQGFGPIFANGIKNGAYRMDLGKPQAVSAITSWSHATGGRRGAQAVSLYGSAHASDPGWNLDDTSRFTALGTISTEGQELDAFTALSLRAEKGKSLGEFRWIVWSVSPVTELGGGENTAFQELAVEVAQGKGATAPASAHSDSSAPAFPGEKSNFRGYDRYDRIKTSAGHFSVVCPKEPAPGKPWLWRSLFWEAIKKVSDADLKLVDEGYHVVLAHGDVAGHPKGNANISAAYDLLTKEYGFAKTCSMSSMSRGTLSLFRWATENPEKVNSIYVDNGVCNVLSWPAGKLVPGNKSIANGAPDSWADFKKKFGYATDEEALKTKESPIDLLEPLAKAGVPILMVCGNKDHAVPYEENDAIMEQRYKALGGDIRVIVEDKGHSHGMNDPTPVLEFIRANAPVAEGQATHAVKANEPLVYKGESGLGSGKHIVFLANDHEYRSEQTCPAIARMLAKHHGFRCTVLFGLNDEGHIHPGGRTVPGLEALKEADMLFLFSRFMNLPDEQVDHLADYLERGGPIVALRTSSHSFNGQSGKWAKLNYNYQGDDYPGGLGRNIIGVTWTDNRDGGQGHYGGNHSEGSRITIAESAASHPILTGVGEMHGYSGAYSSPVPPGATSLIELQVLNSFQPGGEPAKNKPIKTAGWYKDSYTAPSGTQKKARVVYTPFGASEDILDENMRRFLTNASFWAMGMEKQITPDLEVSLVGKYRPSPYSTGSLYFKGVSPSRLAGWESSIMPANAELVGVDQESEKGRQRIERIFKNRPEMAKDLLQKKDTSPQPENAWIIDHDADWAMAEADSANLEFADGLATPTAANATFRSKLKTFDQPQKAQSITIEQSPVWPNWEPIPNLGPSNLGDAPVMLSLGPGNYWMFGRYGGAKKKAFESEPAKLDGFDIPLKTTPFPNQFDAPGGLQPGKGGYHAWQSKDMIHWVHHGAVTEAFSSWVTTAEYADGKLYIYYDYPNDQDPHLYIDEDLTDGVPGKNMGMAFDDPSHGSDCAFIRDLEGRFHVIYEDWSPIDASTHSWDSPLAGHAVSSDGTGKFKILAPAVDVRTKPTGKFAEYPHPHWHATDPEKYPGKPAPEDVPQHRIKKGEIRAFAQYEIHEPEQDAFGDWAAICVGGQYYLFADYHPANDSIRVGWLTSSSLDEPFTFCGEIGKGHPDPDIMFAEGKFYLATQMSTDYVSPGPWVETVEARVGVDTDKDGEVDEWSDWQEVKESYDHTPGFSKQVARTPAKLELSELPEGYGFQFEVRISDSTENESKPILDKITLSLGEQ